MPSLTEGSLDGSPNFPLPFMSIPPAAAYLKKKKKLGRACLWLEVLSLVRQEKSSLLTLQTSSLVLVRRTEDEIRPRTWTEDKDSRGWTS